MVRKAWRVLTTVLCATVAMFLLALFAFPTPSRAFAQQEHSAASTTPATTVTTARAEASEKAATSSTATGTENATVDGSTIVPETENSSGSPTAADTTAENTAEDASDGASDDNDNREPNENNEEETTSPSIPPACIATVKAEATQTSGIDRMLSFSGKASDGPDQEDGNPTSYTIGFTVDNTQVRKDATICFFITGVNAPYIEDISVTGYDEKAGIPAWPTTFTKGWDDTSKSYYYAVTFSEDVPVFTATGGQIHVTYQRGMPLSSTSIPLHISVADQSTEEKAIEQKGSPYNYYVQYTSWSDKSKFYKQIAPDYSQKEGERSRIVQVVGGNGQASEHNGVFYISEEASRPVKYTFSAHWVNYAFNKAVIREQLPTYVDKDGITRTAVLKCPTALDITADASNHGITAPASDCVNSEWDTTSEPGVAIRTFTGATDEIITAIANSPIYLAFPDIRLDKKIESTNQTNAYYAEISNTARISETRASQPDQVDTYVANSAIDGMSPLISELVPETWYNTNGLLSEFINSVSVRQDHDYTSSYSIADYLTNKKKDMPWQVVYYNSSTREKNNLVLSFEAAQGLALSGVRSLMVPRVIRYESSFGYALPSNKYGNGMISEDRVTSLENQIQEIRVCTDQARTQCTSIPQEKLHHETYNNSYDTTFDVGRKLRYIDVIFNPDFVLPVGKGLYMEVTTQFSDPENTHFDADNLWKNNYTSPAFSHASDYQDGTSGDIVTNGREATLTLTPADSDTVMIHDSTAYFNQGDPQAGGTRWKSNTTNGKTLYPSQGDQAHFVTRLYDETWRGKEYSTRLNPDAPYRNLRLVFSAPQGVKLDDARITGFNGVDDMVTSHEVVENYENSGRTALVMYLDRVKYEKYLTTLPSVWPMLGVLLNLDPETIMPGQHTGTFRIQWDQGEYGGLTQPAGTSNDVTQSFYVPTSTIRSFSKYIFTDYASARSVDALSPEATLTSGEDFWYALSENMYGSASAESSTVVDVLPRKGKVVSPVTGETTDFTGRKVTDNLDVYLTQPASAFQVRWDQTSSKNVVSDISLPSEDIVITYTTSDGVYGKAMQTILADTSITWQQASDITDWHAVSAVRVEYKNISKNSTTRVMLPARAEVATVLPGSAEAKVTTSADNYAGRRYSTGNAISEYHAMLNILPKTYTPLTTLPAAGGEGASSLPLWIISAAAAGLALLVCAGVVSVRRRNAAA